MLFKHKLNYIQVYIQTTLHREIRVQSSLTENASKCCLSNITIHLSKHKQSHKNRQILFTQLHVFSHQLKQVTMCKREPTISVSNVI